MKSFRLGAREARLILLIISIAAFLLQLWKHRTGSLQNRSRQHRRGPKRIQ